MQDQVAVMSGVRGLNWFPTGPQVLTRILNWLGFTGTRRVYWRRTETDNQPSELGRLQMIASRNKGLPERFEPQQS
jgi:tRNA (mo5U34)-methyltransferase